MIEHFPALSEVENWFFSWGGRSMQMGKARESQKTGM